MNMKYQNESFLREQYIERGLSQNEIAEQCGVTQPLIHYWLREYDIKKRYCRKDWLREKYHKEGLTQSEIGELCGVSQKTISLKLKQYGMREKSHI